MEASKIDIGKKIRHYRTQRNMSLTELASATRIQIATLSRIENGLMTGTVSCHMKVARALGIELTELYHDLQNDMLPANVDEPIETVPSPDGKVTQEVLARQLTSRKILPMMIKLAPKSATPREDRGPASENFVYVVEGTVDVSSGSQTVKMTPGMSVLFNAAKQYIIANNSDKPAKVLSVSCETA